MTKFKTLKYVDELNLLITQQTKKISSQLKNDIIVSQNAKLKEVLEKISKDYNISANELYNKYLINTSKTKNIVINESSEESSTDENKIMQMVYSIYEINGKEYFVNNDILYDNQKKIVGKLENDKPTFY